MLKNKACIFDPCFDSNMELRWLCMEKHGTSTQEFKVSPESQQFSQKNFVEILNVLLGVSDNETFKCVNYF